MKRLISVVLVLFSFCMLNAQTYDFSSIQLKQEKVKKKNVYEWENFVIANYAYLYDDKSQPNSHSLGITYGRVKLFGYYANFMLGTGMHYGYDYDRKDLYIEPFYTGKRSTNYLSLNAGGIVRLVIPLYVYFGLGYAYFSETREISGGKWYMYSYEYNCHNLSIDCGLQGNINGFTISAGYFIAIPAYDWFGFKVGVGYTFKDKKK